jgi:uncharacterized protein (TIGR02266 family)
MKPIDQRATQYSYVRATVPASQGSRIVRSEEVSGARATRAAAVVRLTVRSATTTVEEFIERHALDVSSEGIFIKTESSVPVGALVAFDFQIAGKKSVIAGIGRVRWRRDAAGGTPDRPAGIGIKFVRVDEPSRAVIDELVATWPEAGTRYEALPVITTRPARRTLAQKTTLMGGSGAALPPVEPRLPLLLPPAPPPSARLDVERERAAMPHMLDESKTTLVGLGASFPQAPAGSVLLPKTAHEANASPVGVQPAPPPPTVPRIVPQPWAEEPRAPLDRPSEESFAPPSGRWKTMAAAGASLLVCAGFALLVMHPRAPWASADPQVEAIPTAAVQAASEAFPVAVPSPPPTERAMAAVAPVATATPVAPTTTPVAPSVPSRPRVLERRNARKVVPPRPVHPVVHPEPDPTPPPPAMSRVDDGF